MVFFFDTEQSANIKMKNRKYCQHCIFSIIICTLSKNIVYSLIAKLPATRYCSTTTKGYEPHGMDFYERFTYYCRGKRR